MDLAQVFRKIKVVCRSGPGEFFLDEVLTCGHLATG